MTGAQISVCSRVHDLLKIISDENIDTGKSTSRRNSFLYPTITFSLQGIINIDIYLACRLPLLTDLFILNFDLAQNLVVIL